MIGKNLRITSKSLFTMRGGILALLVTLLVGTATTRNASAEEIGMAEAAEEMSPQAKVISDKLEEIIIPTIYFEEATIGEALDFLRLRARELDAGETDPAKKGVNLNIIVASDEFTKVESRIITSLMLENVSLKDALQHVAAAAKLHIRISGSGVELAKASDEASVQDDAGDPLNVKLREIVIPSLDLDSATLAEAIDFLRLRAKELDAEDSKRKGVNINIRNNERDQHEMRVYLKMRNASLGACLKLLAEQTGMRVGVMDSSVILEPR